MGRSFEGQRVEYEKSPNSLLCSRNSVIGSSTFSPVKSMSECIYMKQGAYEMAGLLLISLKSYPPKKLIIINRPKSRSRRIENLPEILELVTQMGIEYEVIEHIPPFEDQVRQGSKAGVVLTIHGAGEMNVMWMSPHSALIEVFPWKMITPMYSDLARMCQIYYFPIYSYEPPFHLLENQDKEHCDIYNNPNGFHNGYCWNPSKNGNVNVNIKTLKVALIDCFEWIGAALGARIKV